VFGELVNKNKGNNWMRGQSISSSPSIPNPTTILGE